MPKSVRKSIRKSKKRKSEVKKRVRKSIKTYRLSRKKSVRKSVKPLCKYCDAIPSGKSFVLHHPDCEEYNKHINSLAVLSQKRTLKNIFKEIKCENCGLYGEKLKKCSGCLKAHYCSDLCQKEDWKRHKKECLKLKK